MTTTTGAARRALRGAAAAGALFVIAACGGGGGTFGGLGGGSEGISVSTLSAFPLTYGRLTTVTITGAGLDKGITLDPGNVCTNLDRVPAGSESTQSFSCRIGSIGEYNMKVRDASGRQLATLLVNVPTPQVSITTATGVIVVELDVHSAPASTDNFLFYVTGAAPFYRNTLFHRAEAGVSISAGGFTAGSSGGPLLVAKPNTREAIALESANGQSNLRGTIAMLADPAGSATAKSKFTINLKDNPQLDRQSDTQLGQAVFGRVVSGFDVAEAIGNVPVNPAFDPADVLIPQSPIPITSISQTK
jgi:cyclophilin family peptidyl-prolyl cis-trans isomerase